MIDLKSEDAGQMQLIEREDIDDEEDLFEATDKLISQGINAGDVKKLQDAGIYTCNGLMMQTKKNVTGMNGISEAKFDKIREAAEKLVNFGYVTGSDVLLRRKSVVKIATGSQALDELLGGGIETLCTTEAFGEFRSGKTQLAHTLCVSTQLPINMRGGNGKVAYTDTEGTFRPDRIVPIAERFGMDARAVFDNIIYVRAYTYEHQYNLLLGLAAKIAEEPFRLLIVDSVIALFRVDFTGRGELAECQQKLAQMLSRMTKIAEEFNVSLYMTNQVVADPGGGMFISDLMTPAGGHVLAHAATIRLMFRKGKNSAHTLCVSTQLPAEDSDDYNGQDQEQEGDSLGQYAGSEEDMEEKESDSNKEEKNNTGYAMSEQDWLWLSVSDYHIDEDQILKIYVTRYSDEVTECLDLPRFETEEEFLQYCRDQVYKDAHHLRLVDVSYLNKDGLEQPFEIGSWQALNFQFYEVYACPRNFLLNLPVPNCVPLLYEIKTETGENVEDVIHVTSKFDISGFDSLLQFVSRLKETYPALSIDYSYWYNRRLPDDKRAFSDSEKARWKCFQRSVHKIVICPKPTERVSTLLREKFQKDLKNWEEGEFDFGSSEE